MQCDVFCKCHRCDSIAYVQEQSKKDFEREFRGSRVRMRGRKELYWSNVNRTQPLDLAVTAALQFMNKQTNTKENSMINPIVKAEQSQVTLAEKFGYTEKQLDLVKRTVAKNATDDELELFFYRCKELQLNPLLPGQVYFLKFGNNPGTVIIGLDGFRARAQRTGQLGGIKRGVIRNDQGACTGGWADVFRKDWDHPAHIEVALQEYSDPRKQTWKAMPETMIQKVAEVAALRMAFPDDLGGLYLREEMDQADRDIKDVESHVERRPSEAQLKRLFAIAKSNGFTNEDLKRVLSEDYGCSSTKDLSLDQYNEMCANLEKKTIPVSQQAIYAEPEAIIAKDPLEGWADEDEKYVK